MVRKRKGYKDFWAKLLLHPDGLPRVLASADERNEIYEGEAAFIKQVLALMPGQRVLDMGCGAGDHCLALARNGFRATGIDIAPVLVSAGRRRAKDAELPALFTCGDMRTFRPQETFSGAFTSSGTFGLFKTDEENRAVLRTIHAALASGGKFLIGPSGPSLLCQKSFSNKEWYSLENGFLLRETAWDHTRSQFRESFLFIDENGTLNEFGGFDDASDAQYSRVYSLDELRAMIAEERLLFDAAYGSYELPPKPYVANSARLLILGHKA